MWFKSRNRERYTQLPSGPNEIRECGPDLGQNYSVVWDVSLSGYITKQLSVRVTLVKASGSVLFTPSGCEPESVSVLRCDSLWKNDM